MSARQCHIESVYLDDAEHVGDEAVDTDLQQHHQCPADVLPHLRVFIGCQRKQALDGQAQTRIWKQLEDLAGKRDMDVSGSGLKMNNRRKSDL